MPDRSGEKFQFIYKLPCALGAQTIISKHHRYIIKQSFGHLLFLEQQIAEIESDMEHYFAPYQNEIELLDTIPGVGLHVAQSILAEIGADMSVFPSEAHISTWTVVRGTVEMFRRKVI